MWAYTLLGETGLNENSIMNIGVNYNRSIKMVDANSFAFTVPRNIASNIFGNLTSHIW